MGHQGIPPVRPLLLALLGACASAPPASRPAPAPAPAAATPLPGAPSEVAVSQRPGRAAYDYQAVATVALEGDTSRTGERVSTRAALTLAVTGADPVLRATITVDSFAVSGGARVGPGERLRAPTRVEAAIDARDGRIRIDDRLPADCASPTTAARLTARSVLVSLPPTVVRGATWSDTTATETCRGGLLIRSRAESRYVVEAIEARAGGSDGSTLVRIARHTTGTLTGAPSLGATGPTMSGTSAGTATLLVDPRSGRLVSLEGDATTQLALAIGPRTQRMVQRVRETIARR